MDGLSVDGATCGWLRSAGGGRTDSQAALVLNDDLLGKIPLAKCYVRLHAVWLGKSLAQNFIFAEFMLWAAILEAMIYAAIIPWNHDLVPPGI